MYKKSTKFNSLFLHEAPLNDENFYQFYSLPSVFPKNFPCSSSVDQPFPACSRKKSYQSFWYLYLEISFEHLYLFFFFIYSCSSCLFADCAIIPTPILGIPLWNFSHEPYSRCVNTTAEISWLRTWYGRYDLITGMLISWTHKFLEEFRKSG